MIDVYLVASFFISASWRKEKNGRRHMTFSPSTFCVGRAASGSMANFSVKDLTTLLPAETTGAMELFVVIEALFPRLGHPPLTTAVRPG